MHSVSVCLALIQYLPCLWPVFIGGDANELEASGTKTARARLMIDGGVARCEVRGVPSPQSPMVARDAEWSYFMARSISVHRQCNGSLIECHHAFGRRQR